MLNGLLQKNRMRFRLNQLSHSHPPFRDFKNVYNFFFYQQLIPTKKVGIRLVEYEEGREKREFKKN